MSKPSQSGEARLKETVLVIDDDESVRRGLVWTLNSDYRVLEAACRTGAVKLMQQEAVEVGVSDLHLPPRLEDMSEGLAIIETARAANPPAQVVVITGTNQKSAAREAVTAVACAF